VKAGLVQTRLALDNLSVSNVKPINVRFNACAAVAALRRIATTQLTNANDDEILAAALLNRVDNAIFRMLVGHDAKANPLRAIGNHK
jgi:hypothetical protein